MITSLHLYSDVCDVMHNIYNIAIIMQSQTNRLVKIYDTLESYSL